jgi:type IV fimbrial biogenesis protein FimT
MAVLSVVVILSSIAVPAIGTFVRNARMVTQTNDFLSDLAYARSEAVKRRANVAVCKSSDTATASPPSCDAAGDNWGIGRLIFLDVDGDGVRDAGDEILRVRVPLEGGNTLNGGANVAASIVFAGTGLTTLASPANPGDNAFALCDGPDASRGRAIDIHVTGRPTLSKNPPSCNPPWP